MFSFQGTKQPLVTVCRRYGGYTLLAMSMVVITGCGGGSSGSSVSDTPNSSDNATVTVAPVPTVVANTDTTPLNPLYVGKRELATLTEAVALEFLALGSFERSDGDHSVMLQALLDTPFLLSPGTVNCQLGGNLSKTLKDSVSVDGLFTKHVAQFTYNQCKTKTATINGSNSTTIIDSHDSTNTTTQNQDSDFTVTYSLNNINDVYNGSTSFQTTGAKLFNNQDVYVKESNVEVLKVNLLRISEGSGMIESMTEINGRMYIGNYGYVMPKVLQTLYFSEGNLYAGELILNGANNTKAQVLPTSSTTFVLNTDENGDGAYEKTRIVNWGDL